jgi:hypothetical protein
MSARQIRHTFATPFIVTLASSALAGVGCGPKPLPKHDNPPGPHENPPAPGTPADPKPTGTGPTDPVATPEPPHKNPPAPEAPPVPPVATTPATPATTPATPVPTTPATPKFETKWTVMKFKGKDGCSAMIDVNCPKPEQGKPVATCNPPPPFKYACPDGFREGDTLKIVLRVGATDCFVDSAPINCPKGALCNPPPPRKVDCPIR